MTYQSHSFSVEDALARSQDVYEVEFTNWGVRATPIGTAADVNLQYPPPGVRAVPASLAAISLGPRSTVDRCWTTWDRQKILTVPASDIQDPSAVISPSRIVTVGAPLLFSQATRVGSLGQNPPGGPGQSAYEAMQQGLLYVFPWGAPIDGPPAAPSSLNIWATSNRPLTGVLGATTTLPSSYISMFGTNIPFELTNETEKPFLQLLLYLKQPGLSPPTSRGPFLRTGEWGFAGGAGGYVRRVPIFGRKHVRVQFISHNVSGIPSQIVDYRVGLVRNVNENSVTGGTGQPTPVFEVNAGTALAVPKDTPVEFKIDNPCADYLSLHVQNGAIGPAGGAWTVVAED